MCVSSMMNDRIKTIAMQCSILNGIGEKLNIFCKNYFIQAG